MISLAIKFKNLEGSVRHVIVTIPLGVIGSDFEVKTEDKHSGNSVFMRRAPPSAPRTI